MKIKKNYNIGDDTWIHGVAKVGNKLVKGVVINILDLTDAGYGQDIIHYVIAVPNAIDPLLEIRTWETMSPDSVGPVGGMRDLTSAGDADSTHKKMTHIGYHYDDQPNEIDPTPEQIHAAMERSHQAITYGPLILNKDNKQPRRNSPRKRRP
jgi:hypothetical protein